MKVVKGERGFGIRLQVQFSHFFRSLLVMTEKVGKGRKNHSSSDPSGIPSVSEAGLRHLVPLANCFPLLETDISVYLSIVCCHYTSHQK